MAIDFYDLSDKALDVLECKGFLTVLEGAVRCIDGDTLIYDPVEDEHIKARDFKGGHVLAYNGNELVVAEASAAYRKSIVDLYEVTTVSGKKITVSAGHRFLTPTGWQDVSSFQRDHDSYDESRRKYSACLHQTTVDTYQPIRNVDVRHSLQIIQDYLMNCLNCLHLYGEPLHQVEGIVLNVFPLQVCAQKHNHVEHEDGLYSETACIHPCLSYNHASSLGHGGRVDTCLASFLCHCGSNIFSQHLEFCRFLGQYLRSTNLQRLASLFLHLLQNCKTCEPSVNVPYSSILCAENIATHNYNINMENVKSIKYVKTNYYYDLHVPVYENYIANGIVNHNSGKTIASQIAWFNYLCESPDTTFIMSGKSRGSLYRNVLGGNYGFLAMLGPLAQEKGDKYGNRIVEVTVAPGVVKKVYLFGANDARSYSTIRGITAGGWYADEINTHDEAFIIEAFNRTLVSKDRRHLWTLNPGDPNHFIYTDYLDPYEQNNTPGFRIFRFLLDDNLALTEDRKQEVKAQYSGFYYKRFILGERCSAEGLIYSEINEENFYDDETRPQGLEYISRRLIGIDFGTNNPTVFLNAYDTGDCIYFDDEYYYNSKDKKHMRKQKDPGEYAEDLKEFIARDTISDGVRVAADPSATPLFAACRNRGIILEKANNDVLEGILASSVLYRKRKIKIHRDRCKMYKQELTGYAWDEKAAKAGKEQPIKSNDHVMDCSRYVVKTYIEQYRYSA